MQGFFECGHAGQAGNGRPSGGRRGWGRRTTVFGVGATSPGADPNGGLAVAFPGTTAYGNGFSFKPA